jgi:hypothetical protein
MVAQTNRDRALWKTSTEIFQRFPGLLSTRQIARDDKRVGPISEDPLSDL